MIAGSEQYELDRILSLRSYAILDSAPEAAFDGLAHAASLIADTPIALVSLIDTDRQWFKARVGTDLTHTARAHAFCSHAIDEPDVPLIVTDATVDDRFKENPLVTGDLNLRFYAGFPICDEVGRGLGTLCVIDREPRELTATQIDALLGLARAAEGLLRMRQIANELALSRRLALTFRRGFDATHVGMQLVSPEGTYLQVNDAFATMVGRSPDELVGTHWRDVTHPDDCTDEAHIGDLLASGQLSRHEELVRYVRPDGDWRWGQLNVVPVIAADGRGQINFSQVTDVTETVHARERAEALAAELLRSEQRLSALVDPAPDATFRLDSGGRLAATNPAGRQFIGKRDADCIGRSIDELGFDEELARAVTDLVELASTDGSVQLLDRVLLSSLSESPTWCSVRVAPVGDQHHADTFVVIRDVTETVQTELRLTALALVDPLTGVSNRAGVCDRLERSLIRLDRNRGSGVAVAVVDLDHFKSINDTYGHRVGDDAIVAIARTLESEVREHDTVGRLGGDEFLVLLETVTSSADAEAVMSRVSKALRMVTVATPDGPISVGSSIGLAWTDTRVGPEDFVATADRALYEAKRRGRGRLWVAGVEEMAPFRSNAALMRDLALALPRGEFEIHYQPIVDRCGATVAEEGLLRWVHPEFGILAPAQFLSGLLKTGLIRRVGQWMLRETIASLGRQIACGVMLPEGVHVNLSPGEVGNPRLASLISELLAEHGVPGTAVTVELTEQAFGRASVSTTMIDELGTTGVRLALDDFGTGASSLIHLRSDGLHAVKLDQAFVGGVLSDHRVQAIVRSTIRMALDLGLDVIAEGVETADQRDWLLEHGCTHLQGWYFGAARRRDELIGA